MKGQLAWLSTAGTALAVLALTLSACVGEADDADTGDDNQATDPTGQAAAAVTPTPLPVDTSTTKTSDPPVSSSVLPSNCPGNGQDPEPSPWVPSDPWQRHGY